MSDFANLPSEMTVRDSLFGDAPISAWPPAGAPNGENEPWKSFILAREALAAGNKADAVAHWQRVTQTPGLESRHYVQAWNFLRQHGVLPQLPTAKSLLGVVLEVALNGGLDLLAAYPDGSARYYNYSGAGVVWEHPDPSLDGPILALLKPGQAVLNQIGPWTEERPPAPPQGHVRMSFLAPSGLHFGQGPMAILMQDPAAKAIIDAGVELMRELIDRGNQQQRGQV